MDTPKDIPSLLGDELMEESDTLIVLSLIFFLHFLGYGFAQVWFGFSSCHKFSYFFVILAKFPNKITRH